MIELRAFRNTDPPHIAEIWRSQPPQRALLQPVSAPMLEYGVFSKMQFDRDGLIVAVHDNRPVGFVHAGFGPNEDGSAVDRSLGATYLLMLRGGQRDPALADRLLAASEDYLRRRGASVLYVGGIRPLNAFYLGLYGGSEMPGVLQTDQTLLEVCQRGDYREIDRVCILQSDVTRFRPIVSRGMRAIKRTTQIIEALDPPATSWWEACTWGSQQRIRFSLIDKYRQEVLATASLWDVQPLSASWGTCTAGLFELYVDPQYRRRGYASYLLCETIRTLRRRGIAVVEAQTMVTNEAATAFYERLGFRRVDEGVVFRKESTTNGAVR